MYVSVGEGLLNICRTASMHSDFLQIGLLWLAISIANVRFQSSLFHLFWSADEKDSCYQGYQQHQSAEEIKQRPRKQVGCGGAVVLPVKSGFGPSPRLEVKLPQSNSFTLNVSTNEQD